MKNLIMGTAAILLLAFFLSFQADANKMQTEGMRLQQTANDAARAAALMIDDEAYSEGYIIFDTEAGIEKGNELISENLGLSGSNAVQSYYEGSNIDVYFGFFNQSDGIGSEEDLTEGEEDEDNVYDRAFALELSTYHLYQNGIALKTGQYRYKTDASQYMNESTGCVAFPLNRRSGKSFDKQLTYPCVICVIDTGSPKFAISGLSTLTRIKKAGIYEYKWR